MRTHQKGATTKSLPLSPKNPTKAQLLGPLGFSIGKDLKHSDATQARFALNWCDGPD